jgi:hypothetical protein
VDVRLAIVLMRFRAAAERCGEPLDHLTDAQLLLGLGRVCSEDAFEPGALLAAGVERVGPEWSFLLEAVRSVASEEEAKSWLLRRRTWSWLRKLLVEARGD